MARQANGNPVNISGSKKLTSLLATPGNPQRHCGNLKRRSDLVDERQHGEISFAVAALHPVFAVALAI